MSSVSASPPPAGTSATASSPPTTTTTETTATTTVTVSSAPPHGDSGTTDLEPPSRPYVQTSGAATPHISSARTSFTRVDVLGEDPPRSQDTPDASPRGPSEQSPESQGSLEQSVITPAPPPEPESVTPMDSTAITAAVDESSSLKGLLPAQEGLVPQTPQAFLTFLLVSGKRRTMPFEPETTIGRVKELIWNAWPNDWQSERPPAPSYLRVLYLGKMLQDDETLTKLKIPPSLPNSPQPTIVHLSIRPYGMAGEDGTIKKKRKANDALNGSDDAGAGGGCCGCIIC